jgi:hypothetical protein
MNWHSATVPPEGLAALLARIQVAGGIVACSRPGPDGVHVTWTTRQ